MKYTSLIRSFERYSNNSRVVAIMASFQANSFIDSLSDPKTGTTEKELSLLFLGMDLLDLNKELEEARSSENTSGKHSRPSKVVEKQSYPWWKLW